jgi:hypothetical protein
MPQRSVALMASFAGTVLGRALHVQKVLGASRQPKPRAQASIQDFSPII